MKKILLIVSVICSLFAWSLPATAKDVLVVLTPSTQYTDNSPFTPAGYNLYYSKSPGASCGSAKVADMGVGTPTGYQTRIQTLKAIPEISSGIWYFSVTTYDSNGTESVCTTEVSADAGSGPIVVVKPKAPTGMNVEFPPGN